MRFVSKLAHSIEGALIAGLLFGFVVDIAGGQLSTEPALRAIFDLGALLAAVFITVVLFLFTRKPQD